MPVFLDEEMIGIDHAVIGFPHLLLCMGFVILSSDGDGNASLSGIHLTNTGASQKAFPVFAKKFREAELGAISAIYGTCNRKVRYSAGNLKTAWQNEMSRFAGILGFSGPARGFDTGIINPVDGTYVQYEASATGQPVRIFYKRNEKMVYTGGGPSLPMVKFGRDGPIPEEVADKPDQLLLFTDRIKESGGSKMDAQPKPKKGLFKSTRRLSEVDYSLRLEEFTASGS